MFVNSQSIFKVRGQTGAGMMDVKVALEEANGNAEKAVEILRKKGVIKAASKSERQTRAGLVHAYIHSQGQVGALIEVQCETDFVARNQNFQNLAHDLAMQVVAANPQYLDAASVPSEVVEKENNLQKEILRQEGKPEAMLEKILEGKMQKFYGEICLLNQPFIKDDKFTVQQVIQQAIAAIGENIQVKRFARFAL